MEEADAAEGPLPGIRPAHLWHPLCLFAAWGLLGRREQHQRFSQHPFSAVSGFLIIGGIGYYFVTYEPYGAVFMLIIGFLNLWRMHQINKRVKKD